MNWLKLAGTLVLFVPAWAGAEVVDQDSLSRLLAGRSAACPRPLPDREVPARNRAAGRLFPFFSDSVIRNDFVCNDDETGGARQSGPSIAVDELGNFVVSWYEFRDGDADVWFQRFDSGGNPIGANERINTDISMGWQGDPASAMGPDGRFLFSWEDRRQIGNSDLFCQRFDVSGQRIDDNFRVSDSGARGDQSFSGAQLGPDGSSLIAWDDRRFGITGDIFAQFLNPDGTPRDTNFRVNDDPVGRANQYQPVVSGDDSGRFVVAWMDGRGLNWKDWNVFAQRFDSDGSRLGANIQVTTNDSIQWAPGLGVAPAGRFLVCWEDQRTGEQLDVYARFYETDGQPLGDAFRANDDPGSSNQAGPDAAANRFGEFLLAWGDRRNGNEDVYAQRYSAGGEPVGDNFMVNDDGGSEDQGGPVPGPCPDGGYWVVWADCRDRNSDIYCRRLNRNGNPVGPSFRVNDDSASSQQRVSSIGMDARGVTIVAWEDERSGNTDIYRCMLDSEGRALGPNLLVNDDGSTGASQYYAAVAGGNGRYIVAWTDGRDGFNIYGQFLDGSGQPIGTNQLINSDTVEAHQWYPYCAMDTSNRAVVIWMDTREDAYQVLVRLYGPDCNPVGPEFGVSDSTGSQYYASVARNDNGRFVVAWMDYREEESNIYCQIFQADGTRLGGNVRVNSDTGRAYQGYPACAIANDGGFAVAWEDTRNDWYDVYIQWFDSTGNRLGRNERVVDGPGDVDYYSPTCAFDANGRLAVVFNDERDFPGNPQIYCQRFRTDRTRVSRNQQINGPNLFPHNHHWTVGQSVAVSNQVVACAWTDNRRHQAWDIFAKFTDWNLVGIEHSSQSPVLRTSWLRPTVSGNGRFCVMLDRAQLPCWLTLFDLTGRIVRERGIETQKNLFDFGYLSQGVYFVRVQTNDQTWCRKLVIR